jgi:hypothetical protein
MKTAARRFCAINGSAFIYVKDRTAVGKNECFFDERENFQARFREDGKRFIREATSIK